MAFQNWNPMTQLTRVYCAYTNSSIRFTLDLPLLQLPQEGLNLWPSSWFYIRERYGTCPSVFSFFLDFFWLGCATFCDSVYCIFPFKYKGVKYNSCTTAGNGNIPWCATSLTSDGTYNGWGNCDVEKCQTDKLKGNSDILSNSQIVPLLIYM